HHLSHICHKYLHHHAHCRGQRDDHPFRRRNGELRGEPDLYDHSGFRLQGGERHGGRIFGRGGNELSFQQCYGQPHHLSDICHKYLHHHSLRVHQRDDLPFG